MGPLPTVGAITLTLALLALSPVKSAEFQRPKTAAHARYGGSCVVDNRVYRHGQVFTIGDSRCIKYRCIDGHYDFHEEGCDAWNKCRAVNEVFDHECRSYTCRSTVVLGSYKRYEIQPLSAQYCRDQDGACWRPGVFFKYVLNGQQKYQCSCRPSGLSITYYCYD